MYPMCRNTMKNLWQHLRECCPKWRRIWKAQIPEILFIMKYKHARRVTQLLIGLYMLIYLGLICNENMQIEGFWYYLFTGVFEAATIHYAVAKIFGPLIFGRGWCGYACWTAMVLDFFPYKVPKQPGKKIGWIRYITFAVSLFLRTTGLFANTYVRLPFF